MKNIYFADLTHTAQGVQAKCMPLGAALVASYIKREFKDFFGVRLFKMPEDFESAILEKCPDILCLSNYAWNIRLSVAFAKLVKQINPQLIVIFGGPNFPHKENDRQGFLKEYDCIDFYIFGEGEMALANLLREIIDHDFNVANIKTAKTKMINCSYLANNGNEVISGEWTRTTDLGQYPCPYTDGLMDEFFDLPLIPLYETTRGCPFSCTFCTDGIAEKSKVYRRSRESIQNSLSYISKNIKHSDTLILADLNFGMYGGDIETAEIIAQVKKTTRFPLRLQTSPGKSRPENVMQVVKILDGSWQVGLSFQSTDPDVLKNIKRKNIPITKLIKAAEDVGMRDSILFTEVILGLPGDSLTKHYASLREGVDLGMNIIGMYQLILLIGSNMNSAESREMYGLQTKWRVVPNCAGVYRFFDTELRVAEIEEIVVANNTMTFDDYVECRVMDFVVQVFVVNGWYAELFELMKLYGVKIFDFLVFIKKNRMGFPSGMATIFDGFVNDTCKDLFAGKKDIEAYILGEGILERHVSGELGNNEMFDHKALCYKHFKETTKFIFEMSRRFLGSMGCVDNAIELYLTDLEKFIVCRKDNLMNVDNALTEQFNFDFKLISQANFKVDPHGLAFAQNTLRFFHDEKQSSAIKKALKTFGGSMSGLGRFIENTKMSMMCRQFETSADILSTSRSPVGGLSPVC